MQKITFKGGWWAEVKTEWSYGSDMKIAGAWLHIDESEKFERACRTTLIESVTNANLPDIEGNVVPFSPSMWDQVSGKIARKILMVCRDNWGRWQEDSDPKDTKD